MQDHGVTEAYGLFSDAASLDEAVKDLEKTVFSRQDISVLGNDRALARQYGAPPAHVEDLIDDPQAPRDIVVRPEEKTQGAGVLIGGGFYIGACAAALASGAVSFPAMLAAVAVGGIGGAGAAAVLVAILGRGFDREVAHKVEAGGLLLWVRAPDLVRQDFACNILRHHGATHVGVHTIHNGEPRFHGVAAE